MNESDLTKLKATEQTGVEIRASLGRIASAKASAQNRARDAQLELDEKMRGGTLTSTHRRKLEDISHDQLQAAVMLDALAAEVESPLARIEAKERAERLGAEIIALEAEQIALDQKWKAEYPVHHAAVKSLLFERNDFIRRAIGKGLDLTEFEIPSQEIRLMKTPEQRAHDAIPYWQHEARAFNAANEARRAAREALGPRIVDDSPPMPTLTVGGVPQDITGPSWR